MKKLFLLLILIIPSLCFAQTKHTDWWTIIKGNYFYAYTNNESDAALGVICSDGCVYYANLLVECRGGFQTRPYLHPKPKRTHLAKTKYPAPK